MAYTVRKMVYPTKKDAKRIARYYQKDKIKTRIRKLKTGYKVDLDYGRTL